MKFLIIGDACEDIYHFGEVNRLNPEAPVPLFSEQEYVVKEGMALNVMKNLHALGVKTVELFSKRHCKHRYIDRRSNMQLLRVDNDIKVNPLIVEQVDSVVRDIGSIDAIVISDYDKGYVTYEIIEHIRDTFMVPIFLDTKKKDLHRLHGTLIKINETEWKSRTSDPEKCIVTLGDKGARYNGTTFEIDPVEVHDVCGAGDTFLAALAYKCIVSGSVEAGIIFANEAARITVKKLGVYAPTLEEINAN